MEEHRWTYKSGEEEKGPFSTNEIKDLLAKKLISFDTLIKREGEENWNKIEAEPAFTHGDIDHKEPEVREKPLYALDEESNHRVHPWHRFWARLLDYLLYYYLISFSLSYFLTARVSYSLSYLMVLLFVFVFLEGFLISTFHTTLGKWLFSIKIFKRDKQKMSYLDGLSRSFSVWWLGLGAGIPVVYLITMIVACVKLSNLGITTWDKSGQFEVVHKKIAFYKILIIIALYIFLSWSLYATTIVWIEYTQTVISNAKMI